MKVGIIDLGTNTFNLLIADINASGGFERLFNSKEPVKLGEGSFANNSITDAAVQRGLTALRSQKQTIEEYACDKVFAFATSALRSAANGGEFVARVKDELNIDVRIIDGEEEASMIYQGVQMAQAFDENKPALIMDIGGGSTEFIIADEDELLWKKSFDLGVTRIREKFNPSDPLTSAETEEIKAYIKQEIQALLAALEDNPVELLIGSSGSFDTLTDIIAQKTGEQGEIYPPIQDINFESLQALIDELIKSNRQEREAMPGMVAMRVDLIVIAAIFIEVIIEFAAIKKARLSRYALKEGVLFEVLKGNF